MSGGLAIVASALVILGVGVFTAAVIGLLRMPDVYTKVHAAGMAVGLGIVPLCLAAALASGEPAIRTRVALIGIFLLLTTPVASHVIVQAARAAGEPLAPADALDEERDGGDADG